MPSEKYSCSASADRFSSGITAIEGVWTAACACAHSHPATPAPMITITHAAISIPSGAGASRGRNRWRDGSGDRLRAACENRPIASLRHSDLDRIVLAFALVVLRQLLPQPTGFAAHRGVYSGIERFVFAKDLESQHVFLQLIGLACDLLLHNESQKTAELRRMDEGLAGENFLELG